MFSLHTGMRQGDPLCAYLLYKRITNKLVYRVDPCMIAWCIQGLTLLIPPLIMGAIGF